jgi:hypothetical protein
MAQDHAWAVLHTDASVIVSAHRPIGAAAPAGQLWVKTDYAQRAKLNGFKYFSERYLAQVNCDQGVINRVEWELFAGPGLTGKSRVYAPKDGAAWAIAPDTVDDWVAKAACRRP